MGITALGLVALVICLAAALTTDGFKNPKVLLPICFVIGAIATSASLLLFILKCGCKNDVS